jgi:hypothetical protein
VPRAKWAEGRAPPAARRGAPPAGRAPGRESLRQGEPPAGRGPGAEPWVSSFGDNKHSRKNKSTVCAHESGKITTVQNYLQPCKLGWIVVRTNKVCQAYPKAFFEPSQIISPTTVTKADRISVTFFADRRRPLEMVRIMMLPSEQACRVRAALECTV